jgi:hypothetical protein
VHGPYGLFSERPAAIVPSKGRLPTRWVQGVCCHINLPSETAAFSETRT